MTTTSKSIETRPRLALRLTLAGRVQGVGMRPAVARFAQQLSLTGYVENTNDGVEVHVEGPTSFVRRFQRELRTHLPVAAAVGSIQSAHVEPTGGEAFLIGQDRSQLSHSTDQGTSSAHATLSARIPMDIVVCNECLSDIQSNTDRRYDYPFTSCTACGPRYSIIERMPYERSDTSMASFSFCGQCRGEYEVATNRRFHAQTNACPQCGPQIWIRDITDRVTARCHDAIRAAASTILSDRIVALRGLGGYQLLADATSQTAIERLRQRKGRRGKPLAVMVASLPEAEKLALLCDVEKTVLDSSAGPIVVVNARPGADLPASVTAGINTVGLMLPTTPLHWLLLKEARRPLVCTSGNLDGEPLIYKSEVALDRLDGIADVWLEHNRPIHRPIDDSVVRVIAGRPVTMRLARGYAPLPLDLEAHESFVALGGHQKTTIALSNGAQAVLGPHIGDLNSIATRQRYVEQVDEFSALYGVANSQFVCDQHPEYFTTRWAEDRGIAAAQVQHHHAHVVAGMLEHGWLDRQVLGVSFDGTGQGTDQTIWGGEFLLATSTDFKRVGHLRPILLPGSEQAIRQPWRVATALVRDAVGDEEASKLVFHSGDAKSLVSILHKPALSPATSSVGRLFDGLAALVLGVEQAEFEGQAAMLLESACDSSSIGEYDIVIQNTETKQLDWRPLVRQVLQDRVAGVPPTKMAMRFHRGLASAIIRFCSSYSSLPVVLGGGVFQNRILVELLAEQFAENDQSVGLPGLIPCNDGGLAAGQLAIALAWARQRRTSLCV